MCKMVSCEIEVSIFWKLAKCTLVKQKCDIKCFANVFNHLNTPHPILWSQCTLFAWCMHRIDVDFNLAIFLICFSGLGSFHPSPMLSEVSKFSSRIALCLDLSIFPEKLVLVKTSFPNTAAYDTPCFIMQIVFWGMCTISFPWHTAFCMNTKVCYFDSSDQSILFLCVPYLAGRFSFINFLLATSP